MAVGQVSFHSDKRVSGVGLGFVLGLTLLNVGKEGYVPVIHVVWFVVPTLYRSSSRRKARKCNCEPVEQD